MQCRKMIYKQLVIIIQVLCLCQFAFSLPQKTDQTPKLDHPPKVDQQQKAEQPPQPPDVPKINCTAIVAAQHNATNSATNTTAPDIFPDSNYTIVSANATILNMSSCANAPHVFPDNDSNYTIINNVTILDSLVSYQAKRDNKTDTEVPDLLKIPQVELLPNVTLCNKTHEENGNKTVEMSTTSSVKKQLTTPRTTTVRDPEFDVEQIQSDVSKTEDSKVNANAKLAAIHEDHNHTNRAGTPMVHGQLAAILAGVFAMIAVVAYVGLLTWRRFLERRYGNREMLVNEEEYVNYSDMRNFEL